MTTDSSNTGSMTDGVADRIRGAASTQLSQQKERATEGLAGLSDAIRQSTHTFRDHEQDAIARYVEMAADRIDQVSRHLRDRDIGDLARDAERFARRQPAAFIGVTFMAGMLAARFLKSSAGDGPRHSTTLPSGPVTPSGPGTASRPVTASAPVTPSRPVTPSPASPTTGGLR